MAKLMFVLATPSGYISDGEITILVSYPMVFDYPVFVPLLLLNAPIQIHHLRFLEFSHSPLRHRQCYS